MKSLYLALTLSLTISPLSVAQTVSGVYHTRVHEQVGASQTLQDRFVFRSFANGSGYTATFPFSSVSFQGPSVSGSLAVESGRWFFDDDLVGVTQAQYSSNYPDGTYTMNGGGESASVSLTSTYPNQPLVTLDNGSWQGGRFIMTAEQAESPLNISSNPSTGDGFVSLEVYDQDTDEDLVFVTNEFGDTISHQIPGGRLRPGHSYEVYVEFDEVTDAVDGLDDGTTFALASSGTKLEIFVQYPVLPVVFTATGPKTGRFDFTGENGVTYRLMRSTTLGGSGGETEIDTLVGSGSATSLNYDDASSSDDAAFFWVKAEPIETAPTPAAFATLIGGKTYTGYTFASNNRWSQFGYTGNWTYVTTEAQTGQLTLTYDDLANDPSDEREVFNLDFGSDGDNTTVETVQSFYKNDVVELTDTYTLDLTQNSFAPEADIIEELLVGQTLLSYTFISLSRFTFDGSEPGDWSYSYLNDDSIRIILTYDEDGNSPSVYREEIDLNFNGTTDVPYQYREYSSNTQINSGSGTVEILQP